MTQTYRPELAELPDRMKGLSVHRGYPVPWFVCWMDDEEKPLPRGEGTPDFRVLHPGAFVQAIKENRCWVCGRPLGVYKSFVAGPMCGVNRVSAEPPSHRECAVFSAKNCPFLARPHMVRREAGLPEEHVAPPGEMIARNPGLGMVWTTKRFSLIDVPDQEGYLVRIGEPTSLEFYTEGRESTRAEIDASIESGLPSLMEVAEKEEGGVEALDEMTARFKAMLPPGGEPE